MNGSLTRICVTASLSLSVFLLFSFMHILDFTIKDLQFSSGNKTVKTMILIFPCDFLL